MNPELLRDTIAALEDLGACDNPECPDCPRVLPRLRALLAAPVPDPRTGMDAPDDVLRKISDELSMACDYLTDRGADQDNDLCLVRSHIEEAMIRIETFAAEVRRLRAENATADTEANGYPLTEARLEIDRLRAENIALRKELTTLILVEPNRVVDVVARAALWDALYDIRYPGATEKDEDEIAYAADLALELGRSNDPYADVARAALLATPPRDAPGEPEEGR